MPKSQKLDIYTMPAAGATKTYVATDPVDVYEINATGGAIVLAADMIFTYSGTPRIGSEFKFQYGGGVTQSTSSGWTVSFFGTSLTDEQALLPLVITAYWNGATWEINVTKSIVTEILNPTIASGTGVSITSTGSNPIAYVANSNLACLNTIYISKSGVDATALPNRPDRPYLTIAAGRAAAVALTPTVLTRVRIVVENGTYTNEQIVLYSYVDWDLQSCLIYTTTNTIAITDNNVAVTDCTIYGRANILHTSSSATASALKSFYLQNAGSVVSLYCNDITINSTSTPTTCYAIDVTGTLYLHCNKVYVDAATKNAYGIITLGAGIVSGDVTDNVYCASTYFAVGVGSYGATSNIKLNVKDITVTGAGTNGSVGITAQNGGEFHVRCNNIYNLAATTPTGSYKHSGVSVVIGTSKGYLECNDIIVTPSTDVTATCIHFGLTGFGANTSGALLSIKCREAIITGVAGSTTNYAVLMQNNTGNAPVLMLSGRFKVDSASAVICVQNSAGTLMTKGVTLIASSTGACVANAGLWKDYGATVGNVAASGTIVTVGTPVIDALVV